MMLHIISQKYGKMCLVFLENSQTCQNECVFVVAVMGWSDQRWISNLFLKISLSFKYSLILTIFGKKRREKVDDPSLVTPPGSPHRFRFFHKKNSMLKYLSYRLENGPLTSSSSGHFELQLPDTPCQMGPNPKRGRATKWKSEKGKSVNDLISILLYRNLI